MNLIKYFRIWMKGIKLTMARDMAYPSQFFLHFLVRIIFGIIGPVFAILVYNTTRGIPGWTLDQIILFYGTFNLSLGIAHTFFLDLVGWIPLEIEMGLFDKYLIRPMKLIPMLLSTGFSTDGIADLGVGVALVGYAFWKIGTFTLLGTLAYIILLGLSLFIWMGIVLMVIGLSFIFVRTEVIWSIFDTFLEFVRYPLTIYSGSIRYMLTFIIPLGLASFYPASILLGEIISPLKLVLIGVAAIIFFAVNYMILNYGLSKHTSAGG